MINLALAPDASDRHDRRASQREAVFRLRIFLSDEFEERARRDDAAIALVEATTFGPEIEYRAAPSDAGKLKFTGTSSMPLPAARITGPTSLILMSSDGGRSSSLCCVGMPSSRSCIILQYSAQRTCCS